MIPGNTSSQGKYVDPPTSVSASAGNGQATVSFTLPAYDGKQVATYVATSSPGGITGSGAGSPITVTGLSNGTTYTFTVSTISGYGVSATSAASNAATPTAPPPSFGPSFPPSFGPPTCTPEWSWILDCCSVCPVGSGGSGGGCNSLGYCCGPVYCFTQSNCSRNPCYCGGPYLAGWHFNNPGC